MTSDVRTVFITAYSAMLCVVVMLAWINNREAKL